MRTSVSILLLIVAVVLGISANNGSSAAAQAASEAAASANANATQSRSGYGVGQFWWGNTPANALCEQNSYPVYDAAASRLLLMRGGEFARVLESDLAVTDGISAAPECHYLAASVADRLVIWDVARGARVIELPNAARDPLVLWSPDGESALIAADGNYYLWRDGGAVALSTPPLSIPAYPSIYWDAARAQVIVGADGGVLAFDTASGALRAAYPVAGLVEYRVVGNLLMATGREGIDVWDMRSGAHVRLPNRTSPPDPLSTT